MTRACSKHCAGFHDLQEIFLRDGAHPGATSLFEGDQPFAFQGDQGFAYGGAARVEMLGEDRFGEG